MLGSNDQKSTKCTSLKQWVWVGATLSSIFLLALDVSMGYSAEANSPAGNTAVSLYPLNHYLLEKHNKIQVLSKCYCKLE